MSATTATTVPCGICARPMSHLSVWKPSVGFCCPECAVIPTEQPSLTEDDVRRIVSEELVRAGLIVDRSDDI